MTNVYYNPEQYGLTPVGDLDFSSGSYEFKITAVWTDAAGGLYWADDAGCSCPSPFENLTSIDALEHGDLSRLETHLHARFQARDSYGSVTLDDVNRLLESAAKVGER